MSPFTRVPDDEISNMRIDKQSGKTNEEIAEKYHRNVVTVRKHTKGARPRDSQPESVQQPEPVIKLSEPAIVPPSRRSEARTLLSDGTDVLSDLERSMMHVRVVKEFMGEKKDDPVDSFAKMSEVIDNRVAPMEAEIAKRDAEISELKQRIGQSQVTSLKEYIDKSLQIQKIQSETQQQLADQRLAYELALSKKSEYKEKTEAWVGMAEKIPEIVAKSISSTLTSLQASGLPPGMLLGRARSYGDALVDSMHPMVGGMVAETPIDVSELRHRARRTMVAGPPRPAPYQRSDEELENDVGDFIEAAGLDRDEMERDIHDETDRDKRRDFLAGELAKSRAKIAELEEQQRRGGSRPEPTPQAPQIRRVIAAAPAEKSAEGSP